MRFLGLIILLFTSLAFAQDGISPDTLYNHQVALFAFNNEAWCADTSAGDTSAFYGMVDTVNGGNLNFITDIGSYSYIEGGCFQINARSEYRTGYNDYNINRHAIFFDTREIPGLTSMKEIDSVFIRFELDTAIVPDGDSLFAVKFIPRQDSTPFAESYSESDVLQPCNFYQCSTEVWVDGDNSHWGKYGVNLSDGWNQIKLEPGYINIGDTSAIGFVTRLDCGIPSGTWPTGNNYYRISYDCQGDPYIDSAAITLIYYLGAKYNDISHQDNADGISPDTIRFICSVELEEIATPGYWSQNEMAWYDAFHGLERSYSDTTWPCWGCDSGYVGQWNYAEQPHIEASEYGTGVDWMRRAYYLMELEESIPDTTALDSMRFYCKFNYVHVDEGDSLFIVTYTPRDTCGDSCIIDYKGSWNEGLERFTYPVIIEGGGSPPTRWCNFYQCGDYKIWGDIPDRSYGRVPQYLAWTWFPIHPDIIDFTAASVGDTFGVGLILKDWNSSAPTDTNDISMAVGNDCPYIVYWFSEPEAEAGYINYGLKPPYLNWGLPINQPRRAWGGGRKP